ncbi:MAG: hypothetical protein KC455_11965 [Carnobacterium sp.]|nr:hypothetical protein [Carnobacterium sp.]
MKKRFEVSLTKKNYQKLIGRMNYLSSNRTNIILLCIFLYQDSELSEDRINEQLEKIKEDNEKESFYFMALPYIQNIFKHKKRYFFTLDEYVSAFLSTILEEEANWEELDKKQPKTTSIYSLDKDLVDWLGKFSEKTGISQTTLLNYSFMNPIQFEPYIVGIKNKVRKGLYLTQSNFERFKGVETAKRPSIVEEQIKALKTLTK